MTPSALKRWRSRLGLTQAGAAEALGVPLGTYRDWEQGANDPTWPRLLALACAAVSADLKPVRSK